MSCPAITFPDVDDVLYARLVQQALRSGASFDGDRWKLSSGGMDLEFSVHRENCVLSLTCYKKPFFVSCSRIESEISALIDKARQSP